MSIWSDPTTERVLAVIRACLMLPVRLSVWSIGCLFGYDVALPANDKGGEGHGILTFFAGLLTTQAAGLLILAQGKTSRFIVSHLLVYFAFAIMPLAGIIWIVIRKQITKNGKPHRAFSEQTISFARWTLLYGLMLALALPFLGVIGWIPGQNTRTDFSESYIPSLPVRTSAARDLKGHPSKGANDWLSAMTQGLTPNPESERQLLIVEQDGSFAADYRSIVTSLSFGANAIATDTKAYLVRNASTPDAMPSFEKLHSFPLDEGGRIAKHVVVVNEPSKGDFLVLFLLVEKRDEMGDPLPADSAKYLFHWRVK